MSNAQNDVIDEMIHEADTSPLPVEEERLLTFGEAIQEALSNKRIQRKEWPEGEYGYFEGDFLHIFTKGEPHIWTISKGDVCESDWIAY